MSFPKTKLQWLWENMKGYHAIYILGIFGTILYNFMQLTVPYVSQEIVDRFLTGAGAADNLKNHRDLLFWLLAAMVLLTLLRTSIVYTVCMAYEHCSQSALFRIRNYLFNKIERQDMKFYATYRTGDLMTRLTGDLDAVRHMIAWVIRSIIEAVSLVGATTIYFFIMDWRLALCLIAIAPFIFLIVVLFKNKVAPRHRALREKLSHLNTNAQENISGNRVVKAFAREDYEIEKFDLCNSDYAATNKKTALTWLSFFPYVETFANLLPVVLLLVGGLFLINDQLTMGEYVAFSGLTWAISNPMRQLGNIMNEFQRFSAASRKVMEIYYSEPSIVDAPDAIDHEERFEGRIEFKHVSFAYEDEEAHGPILTDISFTAAPGETIAIMGETGCGKTSLIQLIPRFYDPYEGQVLIDDIDVRKFKLHQLRKNIGLATQDVLLYSDTIDGNIAYGDSHISQAEVARFARYSAASDFIAKMPEGYDTIVGERGVGLSGGQKQRISLARALAIKPAILILDDTTSAVDLETERQIQDSLEHLDFPCTKIIIAQRISTTKNADKILVLQDGRILESGTHRELIEQGGYYAQVVKLQTGEET
ncbi:MAG: ABC transporter ATP-binding protein/permease [Lachnospiraceae bacterium]|nr:ABC transporter ATP-binding protein/permease [Lachnospiraceae bacterium]